MKENETAQIWARHLNVDEGVDLDVVVDVGRDAAALRMSPNNQLTKKAT